MIRIVKSTLRKVLGQARLNYEELYTILTEVEMTINSRPLTYIYESDSFETITPSHLVIGRRLQTNIPTNAELTDEFDCSQEDYTRRVQYLQHTLDQFWNTFHKDYLRIT